MVVQSVSVPAPQATTHSFVRPSEYLPTLERRLVAFISNRLNRSEWKVVAPEDCVQDVMVIAWGKFQADKLRV